MSVTEKPGVAEEVEPDTTEPDADTTEPMDTGTASVDGPPTGVARLVGRLVRGGRRLDLLARRLRGPGLLVVLAVLLLAVGGWYQVRAGELRAAAASANHALVDKDTTAEVAGDVSDEISHVFSYSYQDTEATRRAADTMLTGAAAGQYTTLFAQVRLHAGAEKLVLTTKVVATGVTSLSGDRAQVLVFLDQTATRADTGQHTTAAAQLAVTAQRLDGQWRIADIQAR